LRKKGEKGASIRSRSGRDSGEGGRSLLPPIAFGEGTPFWGRGKRSRKKTDHGGKALRTDLPERIIRSAGVIILWEKPISTKGEKREWWSYKNRPTGRGTKQESRSA